MFKKLKPVLILTPRDEGGFTLVELIMVILILGILAATALTKYFDISSNAKGSEINGVVGILSAANSTNYSGCAANKGVAAVGLCVSPTGFGCNDTYFTSILTGGVMPTDSTGVRFSVVDGGTGAPGASLGSGATATCKFKVQGDVTNANNPAWSIQAP